MRELATEVTLAMDTSAGTQVAVLRGDEVLGRAERPDARGHAENLAPLVASALTEAGLAPRDVGVVVIGTGPAPFTGLRVGLVSAAAFAAAREVPVLGAPSLEGWVPADLPDASVVRVITDARRREVYTASYARDAAAPGGVRVLAPPAVVAPAELAATVAGERAAGVVVVGPGLFADVLGPGGGALDVAALARIARARAAAGEPTPTEPLYLRRPDVHGVTGSAV